jgi:L-lactate dehydrogenase complex protein LldG
VSSAKEEVLSRIRQAVRDVSGIAGEYGSGIPRQFRRAGTLDDRSRIELFIDRLHDYDALVHRSNSFDVAQTISEALRARGKQGLLVPSGLPAEWLPGGFEFKEDRELTYDEIDRSEGVLTGCAAAIALTGSIILRHSAAEGRRALTLIPDYHLCIVHESQIVETVPEAIEQMKSFATAPITTIAGPSATSDIEMTRIKGVHGPRVLEVILVACQICE